MTIDTDGSRAAVTGVLVLGGTLVFLAGTVGSPRATIARRLAPRYPADAVELASIAGAKAAAGAWFAATSIAALAWLLPSHAAIGWSVDFTGRAWIVWSLVAVIDLTAVVRAARSPSMRARYPEARLARWTRTALAVDAAGWIVYLYGYELLFRGVLLFPLAVSWPLGAALAVHTAIYALAHLDKPVLEILGTVPMGFVLGWLALETGSVLPGFVLHAAIAITNDLLCSRREAARAIGQTGGTGSSTGAGGSVAQALERPSGFAGAASAGGSRNAGRDSRSR
jgi:membrane protease YdiL (CAAX protease family)